LKLAGHKAAIVEDQGGLDRALNSGKYDLVLADLSDAATLESEAKSSPSKPAVLPLVYNPTGTELAQAEKKYSCLVKASRKNHDLLAVIDEAMQGKIKGTGAICQKGK
jgi:ABC-type amino acid transport substrate-binding protein